MSSADMEEGFDEFSEATKDTFNEILFTNKCLKVLIEFKSFVDSIFDKIKHNLEENDFSKYKELNDKVNEVYEDQQYYGYGLNDSDDCLVTGVNSSRALCGDSQPVNAKRFLTRRRPTNLL